MRVLLLMILTCLHILFISSSPQTWKLLEISLMIQTSTNQSRIYSWQIHTNNKLKLMWSSDFPLFHFQLILEI